RQAGVARRDVAPAEQQLTLGMDRPLDLLLAGHPRRGLLGKEHHADAVLADRGQRDAELAARAAEEGVRELNQDAGTVALKRVGAGSPTVSKVNQDFQALLDDGVTFASLDVGDKSETTSVVLVDGVVHALTPW